MKIVFLSAECAPFIKAGGLGDVVGSLPPALAKLKIKPVIFLPLNKDVSVKKWKLRKLRKFKISYDEKSEQVEIFKTLLPNSKIEVYFLSNQKYFNKEDAYSGGLKKFLFYSLASLEAMKVLSAQGGVNKIKPDIIHCHDHQTGMTFNILKSIYKNDNFFKQIKTVFTIHNLNYQGKRDPVILDKIDHDIEKLASVANDIKDGDINFMVQGILSSDAVTTVSPTYAKEILKPELGVGLDKILIKRKKDLRGIINGIDMDMFNPVTDKNLRYNYNAQNLEGNTSKLRWAGKAKNKAWLQKKVGLPIDASKPLVGFISRLVWQKGIDLITDEMVENLDCQFIVLGTGEDRYHKHLKQLAKKYPDKFSAQITFSVETASQIYAASDMFLMPSRYEPCGLGQMIAMRYGSVPIVRATGGLRDTVRDFRFSISDFRLANGFVFDKFSSLELEKILQRAINIYQNNPKVWRKLQLNGMKEDFSWKKPAREYVKLYKSVISK
ncbi:MAG: glycogen/starch synthase [Patescibacteria group bacterium]|jgi:starch synthase